MTKLIELRNIRKYFGDHLVLKDISLDINQNEFVTLLGPSGCGKTTLLRIIAGFLDKDAGDLLIDGVDIAHLPPNKRNINTVFQRYALFPHMNVFENIAFGLKIKKEAPDVIALKVRRMLKLVNLEDFEHRKIQSLSGGQQQRIAIARALVNEPQVLLLDEPLGALDLKLRKEMQKELKRIQKEVGITFVFVTHDQEEALTMSDKVVVMNKGEITQIGAPEDIYNEPINRFVANFIGESNIIDGVMLRDYCVAFDGHEFPCVDRGFATNEAVDVVIRPEDLQIKKAGAGVLSAVLKQVIFKGIHYQIVAETTRGAEIQVQMQVSQDNPVVNGDERLTANDFYVDLDDVLKLTELDIIARSDAQAWSDTTKEFVGIKQVEYQLVAVKGSYPVTFTTAQGTKVTVQMIVTDENRVVKAGQHIFAMNFFKSIDDIKDSVALETDLKTWADAYASDLQGTEIEITGVEYHFNPDELVEGCYPVTFYTKGQEYVIDTTAYHQVGEQVSLVVDPENIHIMRKGS